MNSRDSFGPSPLSRRAMLRQTGLGLLGLSLLGRSVSAAAPVPAPSSSTSAPPLLRRFPRMVQEWWIDRVIAVEQAATVRRAGLRTPAEAATWAAATRAAVRACFGELPERTPLNARVTRVTDRGAYRIEHVIFESRPGFLVTGNLYAPRTVVGPGPAVLGVCGHGAAGKSDARYQTWAQALVRCGCVVFIIDPLGQGERAQYLDAAGQPSVRPGTRQHFQAGNQQVLVGEFLGTWRAWDGIRALDYLLTRPEVDAKRVGVTGHSGGGTETTWLCALDSRWAAAAPACFITTFRHNLENELTGDPEQYPPGALARGLDLSDFLVPLAPRPLILLGAEKDFFDVRGLEESAGRLRLIYDLLGKPEQFALHVAPGYHDYSVENQREMVRWFDRALAFPAHETATPSIEPDEALRCTPTGQVAALGARTVFSFTRERSLALARSRPAREGADLRAAVARVLRLPSRTGVPTYRILRPHVSSEYPAPHVASYAVETEPRIQAIVYRLHREDPGEELVARPPRASGPALLYVSHLSADAELRHDPFLRGLVAAESADPIYTCDVRGIGESQPEVGGLPFTGPDTSDFLFAAHGLMLDYPVLGQRTHDVLRVLEWLQSLGHTEVHLAARGWGALPATFAALLFSGVTRVTLHGALSSFSAVAETEYYDCPLALLPPGVLREFDLPDCYRSLAEKKLAQSEPWTPGFPAS